MCGEQLGVASSKVLIQGSSPRVRGTGVALMDNGEAKRDHPRVCGEQTIMPAAYGNNSGSSPRVRGTD